MIKGWVNPDNYESLDDYVQAFTVEHKAPPATCKHCTSDCVVITGNDSTKQTWHCYSCNKSFISKNLVLEGPVV